MQIGYNLWSFLHQFRQTDETGCLLWIDAICIDQQNTIERNHQVAQMRDIYSKATRVIVWLGDNIETDEASEAFNLVIGPHRLSYRDDHRDMRWHRSRRQWRALERLLNRSYWSRVWIIQEFILAKLVEIRCGHQTSPLENFEDICRWLEDFGKPFKSRHSASAGITFSKAYRLFKHRAEWWRTNGIARTFSLRRLFEAYTSSESSDRRDKVYALLGLACNISNDGSPIHADYSKTPVEILIDVVRNQCGWTTRKDELDNQRLVLLLKEALSVEHVEVYNHVLHHARDLLPFLHLLSTTEFVRTDLECIATVIEVGFNHTDQGLISKRSFADWYQRPLDWNSYIDPRRLSQAAVRDVVSEFHNLNHDEVLHQDTWESYGRQQTTFAERDTSSSSTRQPITSAEKLLDEREIFIATNGICGIINCSARSGDIICVNPKQPNPKVALVLRSVGQRDKKENERTVGTAIITRQNLTKASYAQTGNNDLDYLILNQVTGSNQAIYSARYKLEDFTSSKAWTQHVAETGTLERRFAFRLGREDHSMVGSRAEFCFRPIYFPNFLSHGFVSNALNAPDSNAILVRRPYSVRTRTPPTDTTRSGGMHNAELRDLMYRLERRDLEKRIALVGVRPLRVREDESSVLPSLSSFTRDHGFP